MAGLRIKKITQGKYVRGRFIANSTKKKAKRKPKRNPKRAKAKRKTKKTRRRKR